MTTAELVTWMLDLTAKPTMRPVPNKSSHDSYIHYDSLNTKTLAGYFLRKSHRLLENLVDRGHHFSRVLEVGAGTGEHFQFVRHTYDRYYMTDQSNVLLAAAQKKHAAVSEAKLVFEQQDASKTSYPDKSFDRLIATHVLEHLPDPVAVLHEWNRLVRKGGLISIVLPCDPGLIWRIGRYLGPRRNAHRVGIEYDYSMASEHINSIFNLVVQIRYHFPQVQEAWYPARAPVPGINLFYACNIWESYP
jgi:phosphatidylethanolamine/phosphatidyl-N-methylethanolamine N-methyltransferase